MAKTSILTPARLREVLVYNPKTGKFKWRKSHHGVRPVVGCLDRDGYLMIGIDYVIYKAHRLAWLYMTDKWPNYVIDHINGRRSDNRWKNLRDVPLYMNQRNRKLHVNNISGVPGVCYRKPWRVIVGRKEVGTFARKADAVRMARQLRLGWRPKHEI